LKDLMPRGHLVEVVNELVESLAQSELDVYYSVFGAPSFHPKMLLKVWLYGYCNGVYTSRPLAKQMRENLHYIWLSGLQQPCFKTLCGFRSGRMEGMIDDIFVQLLSILVEQGYLDLETFFTDGSKFEANCNKNKRVWAKNTARYKAQVLERLRGILAEFKELQKAEDARFGHKDLAECGDGKTVELVLTAADVQQKLVTVRELMSKYGEKAELDNDCKASQKTLLKIEKQLTEEQEKLQKYEEQERILGSRNSYGKTDEDSTMLRMKDDQLLPAYNVQHTTQNQYILNYTIAQTGSDSPTLPTHLDKLAERLAHIGQDLEGKNGVMDAGYGSEENYADMEKRGVNAYVKYPLWYQEVTGELAKRTFHKENWAYDATTDTYECPEGRKLIFSHEEVRTVGNGYEKKIRIYKSENCGDCPLRMDCMKNPSSVDTNRTVSHSEKGEVYKEQARKLLETEKGRELSVQRNMEVESAFGDIVYNMDYRRFWLRGIKKVYIEYGLVAIAHNLRKLACAKSGIWAAQYAARKQKKEKKAAKTA
jgi:transposase